MNEPYVDYPRTKAEVSATPAELKAALTTWSFGYKAIASGLAGFVVWLLANFLFYFSATLETTLIITSPLVIGHVAATGHTYRAFRAGGDAFPNARRYAWLATALCFLLPVAGLVIPSALRERASWFLRRAGIRITRPKDVPFQLAELERRISNPKSPTDVDTVHEWNR